MDLKFKICKFMLLISWTQQRINHKFFNHLYSYERERERKRERERERERERFLRTHVTKTLF